MIIKNRLVELFEEMEKLERAFNGEWDHKRPAAVTYPARSTSFLKGHGVV